MKGKRFAVEQIVTIVSDQLANGRKLRSLTIIDIYTRDALAIEGGSRLADL